MKLVKRNHVVENTVKAFACTCSCSCACLRAGVDVNDESRSNYLSSKWTDAGVATGI